MSPSAQADQVLSRRSIAQGFCGPAISLYVAALLLLAGCASEGPLRPPSLHLPGPVRSLSAERLGDTVILRWTTPTQTTDGVPLAGRHGGGPLTAEVCREEVPATASCMPVGQIAANSGAPGSFSDTLPQPLTTGNLRPLHYRLRILNGGNRGGEYTAVDTLAGAAPPAIQQLRAAPVPGGVLLQWNRNPAAGNLRTVIRVQRGASAAETDTATPTTNAAILLAVAPSPQDAGGALDSGARQGTAQSYTVVHTRTLNAGGKDLTVSSATAATKVSANARAAPPAAPAGLEAIVNTLAAPEIDLVWQPSAGAVAYRLYRAGGTVEPGPVTAATVQGLNYSDTSVHPGVQYRYSVAAVDGQGTEGVRSPEIMESVPRP